VAVVETEDDDADNATSMAGVGGDQARAGEGGGYATPGRSTESQSLILLVSAVLGLQDVTQL